MTFLATPPEEMSFAALDALYHPDHRARFPRRDEEFRRRRWRAGVELEGVEPISSDVVAFTVAFPNGKRWKITLTVEDEPPRRITDEVWDQIFDFEVTVREATAADGPPLAEIDRIAPIVQGDARVTFDRGDDYFADALLIEHVLVGVADVDGAVAATNWGVVHRPLIGGVERRLGTSLHLRVHPEHQRKGLWSAVNKKLFELFDAHNIETTYAFVHRDNIALQTDLAKGAYRWSVPGLRALLPCADAASPQTGRQATPDDAGQIVDVLNASHGDEEMFVPYTVDSLTARLERAPDLYSWGNIWIDGDAVVGVRPSGLRVIREDAGRRTETVRAFALDHGFLSGAEAQFEGLLRAWCTHLATTGTTELALFTWSGSPTYPIVSALGATIEMFDLFVFSIEEPEGLSTRGLYVDQIYI
jgi:hypothetical protein